MALTGTQIDLENLPGTIPLTDATLPFEQSDVAFQDQERDDASMLTEAKENRLLAESFVFGRGLVGSWNMTERLLRAYVEPIRWKGSTDQFRSNLGIPLLAENFYSILSTVQQMLFSGYRPFQIDPTASTPIEAAQAQEALITAELKSCGYKGVSAKQEIRAIVYDGLLYGTGVGMYGWTTKKVSIKKKRPKNSPINVATGPHGTVSVPQGAEDDLEEYSEEREINHPAFEHVPIRRVRVAPDCRRGDIRTASWAGRLIYLSSYDLDELRDVDGFDIPSREELIKLTTPQKLDMSSQNNMETQGANSANPIMMQAVTPQKAYPENYDGNTVDPLAKKWEIFEYWTPRRVAWILEGRYVLKNQPHDLGKLPFVSWNYREAPDSFFGYGLGFWLRDYQMIAQGIVNAFFDDLNLNLMGTYVRPAGLGSSAQAEWIFPGKVFKSDTPEAFKQLTRNAVGNDPLQIVEQIKAWGASISGAGAGIQGTNPGRTGDMRTGAGVNLMSSGENVKTQDLIDQISELVFVPFLEFCVENNRKLKPSQIREMLNDQLGNAWKATPLSVLNGEYKVTISAGAKLSALKSLNQALGFIETILQAPGTATMLAQQAAKIDFKGFVDTVFESTGFPYEAQIIKPMTDEDKQRVAAQQNQVPRDLAKVQAQTEGKIKVNEAQAENRALLRVQETLLKHGDTPYFESE